MNLRDFCRRSLFEWWFVGNVVRFGYDCTGAYVSDGGNPPSRLFFYRIRCQDHAWRNAV